MAIFRVAAQRQTPASQAARHRQAGREARAGFHPKMRTVLGHSQDRSAPLALVARLARRYVRRLVAHATIEEHMRPYAPRGPRGKYRESDFVA
jgi:hypothetical protein